MKVRLLVVFISGLYTQLIPLYGMHTKDISNHAVYFSFENIHYIIPLKSILTHITCCQPVIDKDGKDKLLGFHHYKPQKVVPLPEGTVCKISDKLWVVTFGDYTAFHRGYVIYNGKVFADPKTFFPATWDKQQVSSYVQELMAYYFSEDSALKPYKIEPACISTHYTLYHFYLKSPVSNKADLRLIIKNYGNFSNGSFVVTLYPLVANSVLTLSQKEIVRALAQKQLKKLSTRQSIMQISSTYTIRVADRVAESKTALMEAASKGDWQLISLLLEQSSSEHAIDQLDSNVLFCALDSDDIYTVQSVIHGQKLEIKNKAGETPLIYALSTGKNIEIIDYLLSWGSDPNQADNFGLTPLMHVIRLAALWQANLQTTQTLMSLLLSYGADPTIQNVEGNTSLMYALAYLGSKAEPYVKLLLQAHADYDIQNKRKEDAIKLAQNKNLTTISKLLKEYDDNKQAWLKENKSTELMYAVYINNSRKVKQLLSQSHGVINAQDNEGRTALYFAIENNNLELITLLLQLGGDPRIKVDNVTIYTYAQEHVELQQEAKELIKQAYENLCAPELEKKRKQHEERVREHKALAQKFKKEAEAGLISPETLKALSVFKDAPLRAAVAKKQYPIVKQLLQFGIKSHMHTNLLVIALDNSDMLMFDILLASGSMPERHIQEVWKDALNDRNYDLIDRISKTLPKIKLAAVVKALQEHNTQLVKMLLSSERSSLELSDLSCCLFAAFDTKNHELIQLLIELYPALAHVVNKNGQTALMIAAQADMVQSMQLLYAAGADLQVKDSAGLMIVNYKLPKKAQELLLNFIVQEKQKIEQKEQEAKKLSQQAQLKTQGWTPLMFAVYYNDTTQCNSNSVNVNSINGDGQTALMIAAHYGKDKALQMLIQHEDIDLNEQDNDGNTALMYAIQAANSSAIKALLHAGALKNIINKAGTSALVLAQNKATSDPELLKLFKQTVNQESISNTSLSCEQALEIITTSTETDALKQWLSNNIHVSNYLLVKACITGNQTAVEKLLQVKNSSVTRTDEYGLSPLMAAVIGGYKDIVKVLLSHKTVDIQLKGQSGLTPLQIAILKGNVEIVKCFVVSGIFPQSLVLKQLDHIFISEALKRAQYNTVVFDCLACLPYTDTNLEVLTEFLILRCVPEECLKLFIPLFEKLSTSLVDSCIKQAVVMNNLPALKILMVLEHTLPTTDVLAVALDFGCTALCNYLISFGGLELTKEYGLGQTPITIAYYSNNTPIIDLLLHYAYKRFTQSKPEANLVVEYNKFKTVVKNSMQPATDEMATEAGKKLLRTIRNHCLAKVELLVAAVDSAQDLSLALIAACQEGHTELVKLLLAQPTIDSNYTAKSLFTPLLAAIMSGRIDIVKLLIALPNLQLHKPRIDNGVIALEVAVRMGNRALVELLLNASQFEPLSMDKNNALITYCLQHNCYEILSLLFKSKKINGNRYLVRTLNLVDAAVSTDNAAIVDLVLSVQNRQNEQAAIAHALCKACYSYNRDIVKVLLSYCDTETVAYLISTGKFNPLMIAVSRGRKDIVEVLLSCKDLEREVKNKLVENTLSVARACGEYEIAQLLIDDGISTSVPDSCSKKAAAMLKSIQQMPRS